jgi:hypothetical protein
MTSNRKSSRQRHCIYSWIVNILVLVGCLQSISIVRVVHGQFAPVPVSSPTVSTSNAAQAPNFGYVSCPVCPDGESLTSAASIIPSGLLPFISGPISCIELEIMGLNLEISPPDCEYLRLNATVSVSKNICGCKSYFIPVAPVAPVAPVPAPIPVVVPVQVPAPAVVPVPVPVVAVVPTLAPIAAVITTTPALVTTTAPVVTTAPIPTMTLAPAIVPPSITINGTIRIRLFFVNAIMVNQTITEYQNTISTFFTNNLNISQYTNISSKLIQQEVLENEKTTSVATTRSTTSTRTRTRRTRSRRTLSTTTTTKNTIRLLQGNSTSLGDSYPLDTYVDITALSIDPTNNNSSTNFVTTLVTVARNNIDELQTSITDLTNIGIINPIYFANIIDVNVTDPLYVGPITSPPMPTKAPIVQVEDDGLSNGAIVIIVLVVVNLVAFIAYYAYNKVYPKSPDNDDDDDDEEEDDEDEGDDEEEKKKKASAAATTVTADSVATPRQSNVVDDDNKSSNTSRIKQSAGEDTRDGLVSANNTNNAIVPINPFGTVEEGEEPDIDLSNDDPLALNQRFPDDTENFSPQAQKQFMGKGGDDDDDANDDGAGDDKDGNSYAFSLEAGTDDGLNTATGTDANNTKTTTSLDNIEDYDGKISLPLSTLVSGSNIAANAGAGGATGTGRNGNNNNNSTTGSVSVITNTTDDGTNTQIDKLFTNPKNMINRIVVAPAGKLGIVIDTTIEGPVVHKVFTNSPLETKIFVGDIIIAIDNVDTRAMSAAAISDLMVRTANQPRKLSVLSADDIRL